MIKRRILQISVFCCFLVAAVIWSTSSLAQLPDRTRNPNTANAGIAKSLAQQIGAGAGNAITPNSSRFIIARDPFRAVRRGRQLFQRKFTRDQGHGPITGDGDGKTSIETDLIIGAGLSDSCASCHGRPKGSAGHRRAAPQLGARIVSFGTTGSEPASPIAAPGAMVVLAAPPGSAAMWSPGPTAATRRTCSAWA